jgi:hypothetical protein
MDDGYATRSHEQCVSYYDFQLTGVAILVGQMEPNETVAVNIEIDALDAEWGA